MDDAKSTCGQPYAYDDRRCALPQDHSPPDLHMSVDGFRWLHYEELIATAGTGDLTDDLWEMWDEPLG